MKFDLHGQWCVEKKVYGKVKNVIYFCFGWGYSYGIVESRAVYAFPSLFLIMEEDDCSFIPMGPLKIGV